MEISRRAFFIRGAGVVPLLSGAAGSNSMLEAAGRSSSKDQNYFPPPDSEGGWRALTRPR